MTHTLFASITIHKRIGSGCFGEVYEAYDPVLGRVAVKIIAKQPQEKDEDWQQRKQGLLMEGQRLREAEHDNVVQVHQVLAYPDGNSVWLVMDFCEYGSLQNQYEQGPMLLRPLRNVLSEAALGLQAIHSRGLIHRDIKPANILLDSNRRARIGDFGFVTGEFIYGYAAIAGYLDHLAIEAHNLRVTSIRTDVWAFGMTAYRLLHGQDFYKMLPSPETRIPEGGFARSLPWLPHIPDRWRRFIKQMMHDDPTKRIQDARGILHGLAKLPTAPDWSCTYSDQIVQWSRVKTQHRSIEVVWNRHSAESHEWQARSLPINNDSGRPIKIGGSEGIVNYSTAENELKQFFKDSR